MKALTPAALLLAALLAAPAPLPAQAVPSAPPPAGATADETPVTLPQYTVSSTAADPYRPADAVSLARIRGLLLDTPVSVNVISRELLDDLGANSVFEATRYFGGVGPGRGSGTAGGISDRQVFRGFESFTRTIDSFSATFIPGNATSIDTFEPEFIERAEIVLGPDAILNPTGSPGGSMNIVTKSPRFERETTMKVQVGNYSAQKVSLDTTGAIGSSKHWAYRVIATGQDTETYIPGDYEKYDVSAQLTYRLSPTSDLTLKYFGVDYQANGNASAPNDNGWLVFEPTSIGGATLADRPQTPGVTFNGKNGVNPHSLTTERTNTATLVYTTTLFDLVSMRLGAGFFARNNVGDSAFPSLSTTSIFNEDTGEVIGVPPGFNPAAVPVVWRFNEEREHMFEVQNDYAANFHVGPVSLQTVAGGTYQRDRKPFTTTGTHAMPNVNLFTGEGQDAPRPAIDTFNFTNSTRSHSRQTQGYGLIKAGFLGDRLLAIGGLTRTWIDTTNFNHNRATRALLSTSSLKGHKDSYITSVLVKPLKTLSLYGTYSTNANPISFGVGNGVSRTIWSKGRQYEEGLKLELLEQRLSFTAAHFDIAQSNLTSPNPLANIDPINNPGTILTDNNSDGWEFNLTGGLTRNTSVIASYTSMEFRDSFNRRVRNVPDGMANLMVNHRVSEGPLKNLNYFVAVTHFGRAAGETQNGFTKKGVPRQIGFFTSAYNVFNAGAGYTLGRYAFNANVDNLLNDKFAWQPASRLTVAQYPGITARLTIAVKY